MINDIKIWTLLLVIIFVPMLKAQDSITLKIVMSFPDKIIHF